MKFQLINYEVVGNMMAYINGMIADGKSPLVTVADKKEDRSSAQNRLMHKWFSDIAEQSGHGVIYEAGRCKIKYFLPILRLSTNEKAIFNIDLCELAFKSRGLEYLSKALGEGLIESTRNLKSKEFEEALTNMQIGESQNYKLTDPDKNGFNWR